MDPVPDYSQVPILLTDAAKQAADDAVQMVFEVHEPDVQLPLAVVVGANDTCDALAIVVGTMKIDTGVRPLKARTMPQASKAQVVGWYRRRGTQAALPVTPADVQAATVPALTDDTPRAEVPSTLPPSLPIDPDPLAPIPATEPLPPPVSDPPVVERPPVVNEPEVTPNGAPKPFPVVDNPPVPDPTPTLVQETTVPAGGTVETPKAETP